MLQLAFALEARTSHEALAMVWIHYITGRHQRPSSGEYHPVQYSPNKDPIQGYGEMKTSMQVTPARS
jgi:hypothetical protein